MSRIRVPRPPALAAILLVLIAATSSPGPAWTAVASQVATAGTVPANPGETAPANPAGAAPANLPGGEHHEKQPMEKENFRAGWLNKPAPDFVLKDLQGKTVRLADFHGKVVLVNFWFSSCPPCRKETPELIQLYELYKGQGLVVLGFNMDELLFGQGQGSYLEGFLRTFKVPYPILNVDMKTWKDFGSPPVQPTSFLIDRSGKVADVFWGAFPGAAFERSVKPRLSEAPAPPAPRTPPAAPVPGT